MAKRTKHTHKYMKQQLSKFNSGWRCVLDYCDHFLPRNVEDTISGRMSICWGCSQEFKLDDDAIQSDMPQCYECRTPKDQLDNMAELEVRIEIAMKKGIPVSEVTQEQINRVRLLRGDIIQSIQTDKPVQKDSETDQIEIIEPENEE